MFQVWGQVLVVEMHYIIKSSNHIELEEDKRCCGCIFQHISNTPMTTNQEFAKFFQAHHPSCLQVSALLLNLLLLHPAFN